MDTFTVFTMLGVMIVTAMLYAALSIILPEFISGLIISALTIAAVVSYWQ